MKIKFNKEIKTTNSYINEEIIKLLINNRKIKNLDDFLNPKSPLDISLKDFDKKYQASFNKVIDLLKKIKKNDQMIVIYTDYDADGITGGAILWETLYLMGFKVMPYVPHRIKEGYGFSIKGIDNIKKQFNPGLIISVDHGITKKKEVLYAKSLGIDVIITDHHLKDDELPKAYAIFHIDKLSGSGVAYYFAKEIFKKMNLKYNDEKLNSNFKTDYLALASIGTVADLVPLIGPSRSIVKFGLKEFLKIKRFGIRQILKQSGISNKEVTTYEIGFIIAPRINALGRLSHGIDALRLLCTNNEKKAEELTKKINDKNKERQDLVMKSLKEAEEIVIKSKNKNKIIILVSEKWHEGIIGLIASKIADEFYRPTLVITRAENNKYKGSARSIPGFDITKFLKSLKKYLIDVGGHPQAAGFSINKKNVSILPTIVGKLENKLIKDSDLEKIVTTDLKIPISKINIELVKNLQKLAPFGIDNNEPTFYSVGEITNISYIGKQSQVVKLLIKEPNKNLNAKDNAIEFIIFRTDNLNRKIVNSQIANIIYTLRINKWKEKEKIQGYISYLECLPGPR